jgi:DNA-binding LacI/PurR family transcriptional regulator
MCEDLVNRTTHTIGVIIPFLTSTFFSSMLGGIQRVAAISCNRIVICKYDEVHSTEIMNTQALNGWIFMPLSWIGLRREAYVKTVHGCLSGNP